MGTITTRSVESELMLDNTQCDQYNNADRSILKRIFLQEIRNNFKIKGSIADLGCGPADYSILLYDTFQEVYYIDAYDGSPSMIEIAKHNLNRYSTNRRINLINKMFDEIYGKYDIIFSTNTLHQLHDPNVFWKTIKRLSKTDSSIFIMDLVRPNKTEDIDRIIHIYEDEQIGGPLFLEDFRNSLLAAFTVDEIKEQLNDHGFDSSLIKVRENPFLSVWLFSQKMPL